jgi:hypothetical protein
MIWKMARNEAEIAAISPVNMLVSVIVVL